jgi:hypothetical protein
VKSAIPQLFLGITSIVALVVAIGGLVAATALTGCNEASQALSDKHMESNNTGLWRKITFYPPNPLQGEPLVWKGRYKVETEGSTIRFLHQGKVITLSGSVVIEETDPFPETK